MEKRAPVGVQGGQNALPPTACATYEIERFRRQHVAVPWPSRNSPACASNVPRRTNRALPVYGERDAEKLRSWDIDASFAHLQGLLLDQLAGIALPHSPSVRATGFPDAGDAGISSPSLGAAHLWYACAMAEAKRVPAVFYRTSDGAEPVRAWLKAMARRIGSRLAWTSRPSSSVGQLACQSVALWEMGCTKSAHTWRTGQPAFCSS